MTAIRRQGQETVYLLEERSLITGLPTGLCKIGFTSRAEVDYRVREYRTGNARELRVVHQVQVVDGQQFEAYLHKRFARRRIRGKGGDEWFWGTRLEFSLAMNGSSWVWRVLQLFTLAVLVVVVVLVLENL